MRLFLKIVRKHGHQDIFMKGKSRSFSKRNAKIGKAINKNIHVSNTWMYIIYYFFASSM